MSKVTPIFRSPLAAMLIAASHMEGGDGIPGYGLGSQSSQSLEHEQRVDEAMAEKARDKPTVH
nr:hypothetical protein [uncultured Pseudomonas sp.]